MSERAQLNFDEAMKEGGSNFRSGSSIVPDGGWRVWEDPRSSCFPQGETSTSTTKYTVC